MLSQLYKKMTIGDVFTVKKEKEKRKLPIGIFFKMPIGDCFLGVNFYSIGDQHFFNADCH